MHRRAFLTGVGSVVSLSCAGCSAPSSDSQIISPHRDTPTLETETAGSEFDSAVEPTLRLGAASGLTFEVAPSREYEYLEANNSVRITWDAGDSSTMPFARWGTQRAVDHASDRLQTLLDEKSLTGTGISVGQGRFELSDIDVPADEEPPTDAEFKRAVALGPMVFHQHHYARDGSLLSEPDVDFQKIVANTPRVMEITVLFPEQEYTAILPVACDRGWIRDE